MVRKNERQMGQWKLDRSLGKGGNATVWQAVSVDTGQKAALKILKNDTNRYIYQRFKDEIGILRALGTHIGVLPLIDFWIPESPTKGRPAWLVTPIAQPIKKALGIDPLLETVIEAIASIARTLEDLSSTHQISHRDVKPDNLYKFEDQWVIGDFGLVDYPGKEALTEPGKRLGPGFYIAPEMLNNPDKADGNRADVYSLAKTLWVLATGQNFPIPGEHRADFFQIALSTFVEHPRAKILDRLIERATKLDPRQRISMSDFSAELNAWASPVPKPVSDDKLSELAEYVSLIYQPEIERQNDQRDQIRRAQITLGKLSIEANHIVTSLRKIGISNAYIDKYGSSIDTSPIMQTEKTLSLAKPIWDEDVVVAAYAPLNRSIRLVCGFALRLFTDEFINITAYDFVSDPQDEDRFLRIWMDGQTVLLGSAQEENLITTLADGLKSNLHKAVEKYLELIEQAKQQ